MGSGVPDCSEFPHTEPGDQPVGEFSARLCVGAAAVKEIPNLGRSRKRYGEVHWRFPDSDGH